MIKLKKLDQPASLKQNKAKWTAELLTAIENGNKNDIRSKKNKYNRPDVKEQLKAETKEKCAYCESKVTVVAHGEIEHITPKSARPELTFEWENLTFACQKCNGKKSDKEGIVDPYVDLIEEHLFFVGHFLRGKTEIGRFTVMQLDLNRAELVGDRSDQLGVIADTLEKIANEPNVRLKKLYINALSDDLDSCKPEYIYMKWSAIAQYKNYNVSHNNQRKE
ncbi:HNH endonuclease [Ruegeria sp.]|uniref:HNH endonuclease n=1 Tax=Ruegeria sp. TaxID=1879320 RepID=UPI003AFFDC7D